MTDGEISTKTDCACADRGIPEGWVCGNPECHNHPVAFTRVTAAPDGSMKSEVYGQGVVYVGIDLAAGEDFSVDHDGLVYALDRRINTYEREPDKATPFIATHRAQPSHRSSHLDRQAQSRAAKAAMIARARGAK